MSLFIVGLSLFSYHSASATSYTVAGSYNSSAVITVTLDKTTYLSGEQIKVSASADTYTNVSTVSVTVSNGVASNNIIPQTSATVAGAAATLTAQAAPGTTYAVSVDATVGGNVVIGNPVVVQFGTWSNSTQTGTICSAPTQTVYLAPPNTTIQTGIGVFYNKTMSIPVTNQTNVQDNINYTTYQISNQGIVGNRNSVQC